MNLLFVSKEITPKLRDFVNSIWREYTNAAVVVLNEDLRSPMFKDMFFIENPYSMLVMTETNNVLNYNMEQFVEICSDFCYMPFFLGGRFEEVLHEECSKAIPECVYCDLDKASEEDVEQLKIWALNSLLNI